MIKKYTRALYFLQYMDHGDVNYSYLSIILENIWNSCPFIVGAPALRRYRRVRHVQFTRINCTKYPDQQTVDPSSNLIRYIRAVFVVMKLVKIVCLGKSLHLIANTVRKANSPNIHNLR